MSEKNRPPSRGDFRSLEVVEPKMKVGVFYDLEPPSKVASGTFRRVRCTNWHPGRPDDYVVSGIPEGGQKEKRFVLHFTDKGVKVLPSLDQGFDIPGSADLI